jgi:hypothetical protein
MSGHSIQVGTLVTAKRDSGVCRAGERGVCYETYTLGGRPGYSFIFERGGYDGFSPEDVDAFLHVTDRVCPEVANYQFTNVVRLSPTAVVSPAASLRAGGSGIRAPGAGAGAATPTTPGPGPPASAGPRRAGGAACGPPGRSAG